jgi:hypothetical protein
LGFSVEAPGIEPSVFARETLDPERSVTIESSEPSGSAPLSVGSHVAVTELSVTIDPVVAALTTALERAAAAGHFEAVIALTAELAARRA